MTASRVLLSSGYCALDVIRHAGEVGHHCGGTAANVATNAAYLGWRTVFTGRLGRDAPGDLVLEDLEAAGVDTTLVERDADVATPVVLHEATPPAHRFHFSCPQCRRDSPKYRPMTPGHAVDVVLPAFGKSAPAVFFFDRASATCVAMAERFRDAGTIVVFEPSARGDADRSSRGASVAHLVKWSAERRTRLRAELFEARADQWQIETVGAAGLQVRRGDSDWTRVPGFAVEAVDSAGAGDWVSAALLADIGTQLISISVDRMMTALARAQAVAALNCRAVGARALAGHSRAAVERAVAALLNGAPPPIATAAELTRSSRPGVCSLCLAPARVPAAC